jgi:hypothetical protein
MSVNLFADEFYSGGGTIPEGAYALRIRTQMFQSVKKETQQPVGKARLSAMVEFFPLDASGAIVEGKKTKAYGMGSKAHESFLPTDDGLGLVPVVGGKFSTLMGSTNWALLRTSLIDSCPEIKTLMENDFSVLDGIRVRIENQPEPEERKGYKSNTADVEDGEDDPNQKRGNGLVPVVVEVTGKPWEDESLKELPEDAPTPVAAKPKPGAAKTVAKPAPAAAKAAPKAAAKPAPAAPVEEDEDARVLAVSLISAQLEANPKGLTRLKCRTEVFKAAGANSNAVIAASFASDELLEGILNGLGYTVDGGQIVPQA